MIGIFLLIKLGLGLIFPVASLDGPWYLSHAFSIINGHQFKSTFAADYIDFFNLPYLYGDICALLYWPFAHTALNIYSIFIVNAILLGLVFFLSYTFYTRKKEPDDLFYILELSILFSGVTYLQRPETMELILILLFHLLLTSESSHRSALYKIFCGLLIAIIGLIHPVGGVYAVGFFIVYSWENKLPLKFLINILLAAALFGGLLYFPIVFIDFDAWKLNFFTRHYTNEGRSATLKNFVQFLQYSMPFGGFLLLFFSKAREKSLLKESIIFLLFAGLILPFGKYYYFVYLFHLLLWRISANNFSDSMKNWQKIVVPLIFVPGMVQTFALSLFQVIENGTYATTFTKILKQSRSIAQNNPSKKVWVSPTLGMSVIDQSNGRMYFEHYVQSTGSKPVLTDDIFLIEHREMKDFITTYIDPVTDTIQVTNIIPPVKGLLLFRTDYRRNDSLGLWAVSIKMK